MSENRTIYLTEYEEDKYERQFHSNFKKQFFSSYDVPDKLRKAIYLDIDSPLLKYICPHCATEIISEWTYVDDAKNRLIENDDYYTKDKIKYKGLVVDSYSGRFKPSYDAQEMPDITQKDFNYIEEKCNKINKDLKNTNSNVFKEIKNVVEMKNCPICNGELLKEFPFVTVNRADLPKEALSADWLNTYNEHFHKEYDKVEEDYKKRGLNYIRYRKDVIQEKKDKIYLHSHTERAESYIENCNIPIPIKSTQTNKTTDFLKEYLLNLINLEANILCLSKRLKELYVLRGETNRDILFEQNFPLFDLVKKVQQKTTALSNAQQKLKTLKKERVSYEIEKLPEKPSEPVMLTPNFFNKKKIAIINERAISDYNEAMEKYNIAVKKSKRLTEINKERAEKSKANKIDKCNKKIDKYTAELSSQKEALKASRANTGNIPTKSVGKKDLLDSEISTVEATLASTYKCRNELYSYNIIFDKYRNIVALSTFYEYLMAGRCETLEGANGAYNIYENESRLDTIVTKLEEISNKLDEIKENQYMIYNKLVSIESSLKSLNSSMKQAISSLESINTNTTNMNKYLEDVSKNTAVIAHNSAVSAYYSKVNAELTNALGFMVALK